MYGSVFFNGEFSRLINPMIYEAYHGVGTNNYYWEDVLRRNLNKLEIFINKQDSDVVYEFENLEELRLFDSHYINKSNNVIMEKLSSIFNIDEREIKNIKPLKLGMTNRSFLFEINDRKYICRIPGEGTEKLINRRQEYESYQSVIPLNITEKIIFMDPVSGIKVAEYEDNARHVNPKKQDELEKCMDVLRKVHTSKIEVSHYFNIESLILFYEGLCLENREISFEDYGQVRIQMSELLSILKGMEIPMIFSHIDPNPDNFLLLEDGRVRLIDWEYSAMSDPLIDISMFSIYSYFDNNEVENLMKIYFGREVDYNERLRVYIYMALGGFLWSLWAEYKQALGVVFGDYTLKMYRYAKVYYKKVKDMIEEVKD